MERSAPGSRSRLQHLRDHGQRDHPWLRAFDPRYPDRAASRASIPGAMPRAASRCTKRYTGVVAIFASRLRAGRGLAIYERNRPLRGFVHVECEDCKASRLGAFSCKTRGWCPSCAAKRGVESATHLADILPRVGYRQWTLTLPRALRWVVGKQPALVRLVEREAVRAVWCRQRARAKQLGVSGPLTGGAVGFLQLFGSALQLSPHLHVLVPEGLWSDAARELVVLPPPDDGEVEAVLHRLLRRLRAGAGRGGASNWPRSGN